MVRLGFALGTVLALALTGITKESTVGSVFTFSSWALCLLCLSNVAACGDPSAGGEPAGPGSTTDAGAPVADAAAPGTDAGTAPSGIAGELLNQTHVRPLGVGPQPIAFEWPSTVDGDVEILEIPIGTIDSGGVPLSLGSRVPSPMLSAAFYTEEGREPGPAGALRFAYQTPTGERVEVTVSIALEIHPCDALAADALDPNRYAEGNFTENGKGGGQEARLIDGNAALPACEAAHADYPLVGRFIVQLGRCHFGLGDLAKSLELTQQAFDLGEPLAIGGLGYSYVRGFGVAVDLERGFSLVSMSAALGYPGSKHQMAIMLQDGQGVVQDEVAALAPLTEAAEFGFHWSQLRLGTTYRDGRGTPLDWDQARLWFERAAAQNNGHAYLNLGVIYLRGNGVAVDGVLAETHLLRAAEFDLEWAYYNLGILYRDGSNGVTADRDKAIDYLTRAAAAGVQPAQDALDAMP